MFAGVAEAVGRSGIEPFHAALVMYGAAGVVAQPPYHGMWLHIQRGSHVPQDLGSLRSPLQQGNLGSCAWQDEHELAKHLLLGLRPQRIIDQRELNGTEDVGDLAVFFLRAAAPPF